MTNKTQLKRDFASARLAIAKTPSINSLSDLKSVLARVNKIQNQKDKRGEKIGRLLGDIATIRLKFFRELSASTSRMRGFVEQRDVLERNLSDALARSKRDGTKGDRAQGEFNKKMAALERRAATQLSLRSIKAKDFESFLTSSRPLTLDEMQFLRALRRDVKTIRSDLKVAMNQNMVSLVAVQGTIAGVQKFTGLGGLTLGRLDTSAAVEDKAKQAINRLKVFKQHLQRERGALGAAMSQISRLGSAASATATVNEAVSALSTAANLGFVVVAMSILTGAAASSPIVGIIATLTLLSFGLRKVLSWLSDTAAEVRRL